jgi:hypothetical protein
MAGKMLFGLSLDTAPPVHGYSILIVTLWLQGICERGREGAGVAPAAVHGIMKGNAGIDAGFSDRILADRIFANFSA